MISYLPKSILNERFSSEIESIVLSIRRICSMDSLVTWLVQVLEPIINPKHAEIKHIITASVKLNFFIDVNLHSFPYVFQMRP